MYYALEASIQQIYNLHIDTGQEDAAVACAGGRGGGAAGSPRPRHRQLLRQLRHLPQLPAGVQVSCDWSSQCSPLIGQGRPQQAGQGGHQARLQHQHQAQAELDTIQKYHQQIQIVECFLFYRNRYVINIIKNLNCTLQINQSIIIHQVIFLERTEPLSSLLCNN